jgi:puromycin-sensitive aminopeptidase
VQEDGKANLGLRQQRFFANPKAADTKQKWPLPLVIKVGTKRGSTRLVRQLVTKTRDKVELGSASAVAWYYANANEGGFHRPLHDEANLEALSASLPTSLTAAERMGLVGHQWAAVRGGHARIESFLRLASRLGDESDFDVLDALSGPLRYLEDYLVPDADAGRDFRAWLASVFGPAFRSLGWGDGAQEADDVRVRRASLLRIVGELADDDTVAADAAGRLQAYLADRSSLEPNLADSVVSIAARRGDAALYDRLLALVPEAQTPQEKRRFQMALADFRTAALIDRTLALTLKDDISTQDVGIVYIRLFGNSAARERTWAFVKKRWDAVSKRLPPMMVSRVVDSTPILRTKEYKQDVAAFFKAHPVATAQRALRQALERFDLNAELARRASKSLGAWLASQR